VNLDADGVLRSEFASIWKNNLNPKHPMIEQETLSKILEHGIMKGADFAEVFVEDSLTSSFNLIDQKNRSDPVVQLLRNRHTSSIRG
jgi:DNA-directed RNA polymerase subunit H (RpoH/RPB5)